MATATTSPDNYLVTQLGKLHPDYSISVFQPVNEVYPYLYVTNGRVGVNTQIRLAKNYWSVSVIDRLVVKAIKNIESATPNIIKKGKSNAPQQ